ncbi:serine/threonine-protein kinase [Micromonospora thermarum]|uniref:non-specific serine/threonine protein kinase n=1 Tax=Micromonospora thermarum TaxID=2720024 RepID=A0ABX0Z6E6_9ACTN|nr:serine/threonine-protein kinase [Micromonospora thermarum]NJP32718.1 serine/threonine protein kinase [Micromonospora thermarum]
MSNALPQLVADRYRLISPLGQGGMGRVWKARDEVLHRDVAIKELVPPPSLTDEERREMRERSLREARAIARLNHINVVRIFDVLRTDGDPWIVMEYVPSKSLQDTLAEDGPVSPARAVEIGLGVLAALKAAHKAGVMHRDIKPGNVLLGNDGRVVLTDFGLATIPGDPNVTRTGMVLGSPAYIAPERARDGTAGPEADLWSLGATLYAAVEGKSPYARPSAIATLAALATEPLPPPKNAGPLRPVLNGLLRKDPNERITAEVAEKLLRRAGGKRSRTIPLLDGVRRPGPSGRREPRPPVVPSPRPAERESDKPVAPPAPRQPAAGAAAAAAADAPATVTPTASDAAPTAKVTPPPSTPDAGPPTKAAEPAPKAAESASKAAPPPAPDDTKVEPAATSVLPRPAPAPAGRAAVPPPDGTKRDTTRRNLLIGVVVAVLLLGLAVVVPLLTNDDDGGDPSGAGATSGAPTSASPPTSAPAPANPAPSSAAPTSASPTPSATTGAALPAGWTLHKDATGFSVPLPPGFKLNYRRKWGPGPEDYRVRFSDGQGRALLIDQTTSPQKDAEADWRSQEARRRDDYAGYQFVKIDSVDYWDEAADWEWIYTEGGQRVHVRNRGFVTAPDKGYAIRWDCPESEWAANEQTFRTIADGFVPVRS